MLLVSRLVVELGSWLDFESDKDLGMWLVSLLELQLAILLVSK